MLKYFVNIVIFVRQYIYLSSYQSLYVFIYRHIHLNMTRVNVKIERLFFD